MPDPLAGRHADAAAALLLGLAAALGCLAVWAWRRRHHPGVGTPVAGLALAVAGAAGIALRVGQDAGRPPVLPWPVMALAVAGAGVLLADVDRRWRGRGLALPLLAVCLAGIYTTVPDVEAALMALGAALPLALLGWPGPVARDPAQPPPSLGAAGAFAVAGLLVWTAATGSAGRPGAFVGALVCLGVFLVEPLARRLDPGRRSPLGPPGGRRAPLLALAGQVVLAAVGARVVGRPATIAAALPLAALVLAAALAAALALARRSSGERTAS